MKDHKGSNHKFNYRVKRSFGNQLSLVLDSGALTVVAAFHIPEKEIEDYVEQNQGWIEKARSRGLDAKLSGNILYRGMDYPVEVITGLNEEGLSFEDGLFSIYLQNDNEKTRKKLMEEWFTTETQRLILPRIEKYKGQVGVKPGKIAIEKMFARWAACSNMGNMKFHWKCGMLPDEIIDYVVVHELCHLIYLNHLKEYWEKVESIMPDYRWRKEWLETHGGEIIIS